MIIDGDYADDQLLLTTVQAAKVLSVSRATIYDLIKHGELRAVHISRSCRISWAELERFVAGLEIDAEADSVDSVARPHRRWRRVIAPDGHRLVVPVELVGQADGRT